MPDGYAYLADFVECLWGFCVNIQTMSPEQVC